MRPLLPRPPRRTGGSTLERPGSIPFGSHANGFSSRRSQRAHRAVHPDLDALVRDFRSGLRRAHVRGSVEFDRERASWWPLRSSRCVVNCEDGLGARDLFRQTTIACMSRAKFWTAHRAPAPGRDGSSLSAIGDVDHATHGAPRGVLGIAHAAAPQTASVRGAGTSERGVTVDGSANQAWRCTGSSWVASTTRSTRRCAC